MSRRRVSRAQRLVAGLGAVAALAPAAAACPYCAVSQGFDTLIYIAGFLIIPYVVVGGTWWWMKRLLASEHEG